MDRATASPAVHTLPGPAARTIIDRHHRVAAPGEYDHEFVWDVTAEAIGPFCTDVDGNVFLDFTSHIGSAPLGYNDPSLLSKLSAVDFVDPAKIAGQDFYYSGGSDPDAPSIPGSTHLMEQLVDRSAHYGMDTVFLSNSGAEAIENAVKIAHASRKRATTGIAFNGSFHGRTIGALSITKAAPVYTRDYPRIGGIETVPFCTDRRCSPTSCTCGFFAGGTSRLAELLPPNGYLAPEEVGYVVLEPIQGVGGYRMASKAFMREVQRITDRFDIPLIVDEVQTGIGRSGKMWASDHYPIEPDIIAGGKALRVGATVSRSDLFPTADNRLGSTWGAGDLYASMLGVFTLEILDEQSLMSNASTRGRQLTETLIDAALPGVVDIRNLGLLVAVEFESAERRDATIESLLGRGLLVTGCGQRTIRLLPPLTVTEREISMGSELFVDAVAATA